MLLNSNSSQISGSKRRLSNKFLDESELSLVFPNQHAEMLR